MRRFACGLGITIAAICFASVSIAQLQPSSPTVWSRDFVDGYCAITTGSPDSVGLSFRMTPGDPDPQLYVVGSSKIIPANVSDAGEVVLSPSGDSFPVKIAEKPGRSTPRVLMLIELGHKFPAAFAQASELRLTTGATTITIPIKGAAKASTALQECIDWKLREWGIDPAFWASL